MSLFDWIPLPARFRRVRAPKLVLDGKLHCSECGGSIRRHDRYVILSARHRDCGDPKLVGQKRLTGLLPNSTPYVQMTYLNADNQPIPIPESECHQHD